jgi:hypothetical protein
MRRWEHIARFAWAAVQREGRGVVLVDRSDLLADDDDGPVPLGFVPATHIPRGDDFATIIQSYDPLRQVALLVGGTGGEEQLLVLEPADASRPGPPDC